MKYFFDCKTLEEAKLKYRKLAMELHPDRGGSNALMSELTLQYDAFVEDESVHPYEESLKQAFEQARQYNDEQRRYYQGFGYNTGYQYRPAGAINNAYFNPDELQKVRTELNEARNRIADIESTKEYWYRCCNEQKIEIAELKKNCVGFQHDLDNALNVISKLSRELNEKPKSLWQSIKTAYAGLRGYNNV